MSFRKRDLVIPIYLPSFFLSSAEAALIPILPMSAVSYGLGLAEAALVTTLMLLSIMISELPAGWITSRIGERRALLAASLGAALTMAIAFFNLGYWALLLSAMLFGFFYSLFGLSRHALLTHMTHGPGRPRAMSLLGGMFRGGWAIGPMVGAGFIAWFGLESAYLAAMLMALLAFAAVSNIKPTATDSSTSGRHGGIWKVAVAERSKLLTLGVASGIISGARTIRMVGLPLLAIALEIDPATSSFIFGFTGLIDFALFYFSGLIMERFGKVWSSVPTLVVLGISYLFAFAVTDLASFWILAFVTALANAASAGINMVLGADLAPHGARSEFLASFRLLTSGGSALAPALIAALTAAISLPAALAITGVGNFVGAFLFWKYLPKYAPDQIKRPDSSEH